MRLLHYFLGFPPYRSGGLTKYSFDLMKAQVDYGDVVYALWPGTMLPGAGRVHIKKRKDVYMINNYELINPLPVPLDEGIKEPDRFMKTCDPKVFRKFLLDIKPDVIHVHTLMGIYKEFFEVAESLNIRTVFTSHDYFGLCPKVTMYREGCVCDNTGDCEDCFACNHSALSMNKILLLQSPIYRYMKSFKFIKRLRQKHREKFFLEDVQIKKEKSQCPEKVLEYRRLRNYYVSILEKIDMIHFNSTVAEQVYKSNMLPKDSRVISITHKEIGDNREHKKIDSEVLRITYLAQAKANKGYDVLVSALNELKEEGFCNFKLRLFTNVPKEEPYMEIKKDGYLYSELGKIMEETDVLVVPSTWKETFGFTALEAISYGVPVIVSDFVGAKDIIKDGGITVEAGSVDSLKKALLAMTSEKICELTDNIREHVTIKTWDKFMQENYELYKEKSCCS